MFNRVLITPLISSCLLDPVATDWSKSLPRFLQYPYFDSNPENSRLVFSVEAKIVLT